ncbi:Hypothetical protein NTJ_03222 [Nesidiocoris tenuis]|uniref:Uncharacterized protein n=1 Tax=Nesidiocoris tenuis TaxID=355587 RepID=A0ABN7ADT1_9HEMI|nr:Hypothetical protein NTJ_03222 [Nesidiocoris tenuis]
MLTHALADSAPPGNLRLTGPRAGGLCSALNISRDAWPPGRLVCGSCEVPRVLSYINLPSRESLPAQIVPPPGLASPPSAWAGLG